MELSKAIFTGTSHTAGLGLEMEFSERFQDDNYLTNICKSIPPVEHSSGKYEVYTEEDINNHKKYRWSKLVSDKLNVEEINVNDIGSNKIKIIHESRNSIDFILNLSQKIYDTEVVDLLSKTKYIFLEIGYIRWWETDLHGSDGGEKWPSTPAEIINFIESPHTKLKDKQKAIDWVYNFNPYSTWNVSLNNINLIKNSFPHIQIVILGWGVHANVIEMAKNKNLLDLFVKIDEDNSDFYLKYRIHEFLLKNRLCIKHVVMGYNSKYKDKWLYEDEHASSKGHLIVSDLVIKHIQNK
jgi:hypothetical protein